jgi:hypothetical protein
VTLPQVRHSYVPITAAEYDAAARLTPAACLNRACGDLRTGAQLLADAAADARVRISSLAHSAEGCALVRRLVAALRCHLAAYARAVGGVGPVDTVSNMCARHPAAGAASAACTPPHGAARLWLPAHDNAAPPPPCLPPAAAARRATETMGCGQQPARACDAEAGGGGARGGGEWGGAEGCGRLEGADPFHDDWAFWDPAPHPA